MRIYNIMGYCMRILTGAYIFKYRIWLNKGNFFSLYKVAPVFQGHVYIKKMSIEGKTILLFSKIP